MGRFGGRACPAPSAPGLSRAKRQKVGCSRFPRRWAGREFWQPRGEPAGHALRARRRPRARQGGKGFLQAGRPGSNWAVVSLVRGATARAIHPGNAARYDHQEDRGSCRVAISSFIPKNQEMQGLMEHSAEGEVRPRFGVRKTRGELVVWLVSMFAGDGVAVGADGDLRNCGQELEVGSRPIWSTSSAASK
jgi:hypothetical protein